MDRIQPCLELVYMLSDVVSERLAMHLILSPSGEELVPFSAFFERDGRKFHVVLFSSS